MRIAALIAFVMLVLPQAEPAVTLEGVVTESGTASPLPSVQVRLTGMRSSDSGSVSLHVSTGANGHFQISAPPGDYTVTWQREGLFDALNNGVLQENGTKLTLVKGQSGPPLSLSLTSGGVVSGRILTQDGAPASRVTVSAMQVGYGPRGERTIRTIESEDANDRGEYRLYWIPPGDYIIGFAPSVSVGTQTLTSTSGIPSSHVRTFYPGTSDMSKARVIAVGPHSEVADITFSIRDVPVFNVTGRANYPFVPPPPGQATSLNQNPSVTLLSNEPGSQRYAFIPSSPGNATVQGIFQLRGIPAGHYNMLATVGPAAGAVAYSGQMPIDIANQNVEDVTLTLRPAVEIPGRIVINPPGPMPPELTFVPADNMTAVSSPRIVPAATGDFTFKGTVGGSFALMPALPPGLYVADLRQGDQSRYLDGTIRVSEANEPIQIVLGATAATVAGTLEGSKKRKVVAVLVPDAPRRGNYFLYALAAVDDSGKFKITGIAPGSYRLFAFDAAVSGGWMDSDFISKYEDLGIPLTVSTTTNESNLRLKVVEAQRQN